MKGVWTATAVITSAIGYLLLNGPVMLSNAEKLPSALESTRNKVSGWYYEDAQWTGRWSATPASDPESCCSVNQDDVPEENLSDIDVRLEIEVKNGEIIGTIATKKACAEAPGVFVIFATGSVSGFKPGKKAEILASIVIGGRTNHIAKLTLQRKGHTMVVTPKEEFVDWFPKTAKIARHFDGDKDGEFHNLCKEEERAYLEEIKRKLRKPLEQGRRPVGEF